MPGKKDEVAAKAAMKPGSVSVAPSWTLNNKDDGKGEFQVAGKKKGGNSGYRPPPPAVTNAPFIRPAAPVKQTVDRRAAPIVGATLAVENKWATKAKPQKANKGKPAPAAAAQVDEDAAWQTVKKPQPKAAPKEFKTAKHLAGEQKAAQRKQISQQNTTIVGAAPVVDDDAEQKRQEKEYKKRLKEMEKQRLAAAAKQQEQKQVHKDPADDGFKQVQKGAKPTKVVASIQSLGTTNTAFSKLQKQTDGHRKVPKQKNEGRQVAELSDDARQEILRRQHEALTKKPSPAEVSYQVQVQGKWYAVRNLLATNDFAHAPKMVQAAATQSQTKFVGGFFVDVEHQAWADANTVDELWMANAYFTGLTKLLETEDKQTIQPYWPEKKGQKADTTLALNKTTFQEGCWPTLTLAHVQKHPTSLQSTTVSVHQFAESLIEEGRLLIEFLERVATALEEVGQKKNFKDGVNRQKLDDFKSKLPKKVASLVDDLEAAYKEFVEKHPAPSNDDEE
eukprot:Rhum_TRINITY_DN4246_c0_g1::Rhum_TRINITY_DN4246_c0_g1_i1::g.13447::m.13447